MLKNYIKIAVRNFLTNKAYSFINIFGLAIGIAGSLLMLVYVADQLSYESMHNNCAQIYRVSVNFASLKLATSFPALGQASSEEIPDVKAAVRFRIDHNADIKIADKEFKETKFFFADSNIFNVFTFPLVEGDKNSVLNNPSSIVISEEVAHKYFGNSDPIGKRLTYNDRYEFIISGIMKDVRANTMLKCEIIAPYSRAMQINKPLMPWAQFGDDYTYLYLKDNTNIESLKKKLQNLYAHHTNEGMASIVKFVILPIRDIYFKSDMIGELGPTGNYNSVYLFSSISILTLLIACLNFINLFTAKSLRRSKEVGVRKVLGASRGKLIIQFLSETFTLTFIAFILGILIYELVRPLLYNYFQLQLSGTSFLNFNFAITILAIIIIVNLIAGIYPAAFLSKHKPLDTFKSTKLPESSGVTLRKLLINIQFVFTIFGTAAIYEQLNFMQNSNLGFNKNDVLILNYPVSDNNSAGKFVVIKQALKSIPGVIDVSGASTLPGTNFKETQSVRIKGNTDKGFSVFQTIGVDYEFIPTLGLKIIKGRNFSKKYVLDSAEAIILNETAVIKLGLINPIGAEVIVPDGANRERIVKIIGVIKDFHVTSFHNIIEPMFLYIDPAKYYNIALKINAENKSNIVASIKSDWEKILPNKEFNYSFLEQTYNNLYQADRRTGSLSSIFSLLSIFITCVGLFGLISYTIETRVKEIGIRKVLGANFSSIVFLLSKDYLKWILIANIVAWPAAYYAISRWLNEFVYKAAINISIYFAATIIVLLIAIVTISFQTLKAAAANPVKSLRYE
jgi:putative ABC transport system permease protein